MNPSPNGQAPDPRREPWRRERQGGRRGLDGSHGETKVWGRSEKGCGAGGEGRGVGIGGLWAASQGVAASQSGPRFGSVADDFTARL